MKAWMPAVALAAMVTTTGCGYNQIQQLDESTEANRANVQTELQRRNDLIPNLVATVEEAARFQQETFTRVAEARAGLLQTRERLNEALAANAPAADLAAAANAMSENLRLFVNVAVEAYPDLTANENFLALQDELTETENRIAVARRDYNEAVQSYNTFIRRFPQLITAKIIGAGRKTPFEASETAQQAPTVRFGRDSSGR